MTLIYAVLEPAEYAQKLSGTRLHKRVKLLHGTKLERGGDYKDRWLRYSKASFN